MNQSNSNKTLVAILGLTAATLSANADLIFDRGLPTANLNIAAGANRANTAWNDSETIAAPTEYYLPGDNFTLGGSGSYQLDTIRIWTTSASSGLSLLGGLNGNPMSTVSSSYTATSVTYADSSTFQQSLGPYVGLTQIDFAVNLTLNAGDTYDFFLNGPFTLFATDDYRNSYLHSSNAGLSGSTQEGADDTFLWLHINGASETVETWKTGDGTGTSGFGQGLDKNSDGNVQVFGTPVPEPGSLALIACGALLIPFNKNLRRKLGLCKRG